jgi:hypothetical protein
MRFGFLRDNEKARRSPQDESDRLADLRLGGDFAG